MSTGSMYCSKCKTQVATDKPRANHILHLLLTLFLCGWWLPVWLLFALFPGAQRCRQCGATSTTSKVANALAYCMAVGAVGLAFVSVKAAMSGIGSRTPTQTTSTSPIVNVPPATNSAPPKTTDPPKSESSKEPKESKELPIADPPTSKQQLPDEEADVERRNAIPEPSKSLVTAIVPNQQVDETKTQTNNHPEEAESILKLGKQLAAAGKTEGAERYYRKVLEKHPETEAAIEARTLLGVPAGSLLSSSGLRTWTDVKGKQLEASFESYLNGRVVLKKGDSTTLAVPLERLSPADQQYVKAISQPAP